jgi:hypothetical protein
LAFTFGSMPGIITIFFMALALRNQCTDTGRLLEVQS